MPKEVNLTRYVCNVCSKDHATSRKAKECERKCKQIAKLEAEEQAVRDEIKEIRDNSNTPDELFDSILVFMKKHFGEGAVFGVRGYSKLIFSIVISKNKVKKSFSRYEEDFFNPGTIDTDLLLSAFGISTPGSGGNVKMRYYDGCEIVLDKLPRIKENFDLRNNAVTGACELLRITQQSVVSEMFEDHTYKEHKHQIDLLEKQICELKDQIASIRVKTVEYVMGKYDPIIQQKYKELVDELPVYMAKEVQIPGAGFYSVKHFV